MQVSSIRPTNFIETGQLSTALKSLFDHPDVGGDDLTPTDCAVILPQLEAITDHWARERGDQCLSSTQDVCQPTGIFAILHREGRPAGPSVKPPDDRTC
ncbi:hypothetical protein PYK79_24080 [Streptomyces sp. ID05-04B]|uniref:hypothetical protein n=1 Tax=Streptomyces sp. ID05-04B TaxID=3028661 RepID=UPI0029C34809|nr:hypothetical protein [Streptomyces sp. ID05-04B]MDX5565782.1 hypothetical protein [Streptomyces sp. ID05-04B]